MNMEKTIQLAIIVPDGKAVQVRCDSVRFMIPDGAKNKNAGGSVGIRPGHMDALMSAAAGEVTAVLDGKTVLQCTIDPGIAIVDKENVTILTDRIQDQK